MRSGETDADLEQATSGLTRGGFMRRRAMLTATIALGLWGFGGTDIAHGLVIVSPRSGETFLEGQSVKVVAEFSPDDPDDLVDIGFVITDNLGSCSKEILSLPLECTFTIPSGSPRRIEIAVMGARATVEDAVSSPTVTIFVGLPPTVTLLAVRLPSTSPDVPMEMFCVATISPTTFPSTRMLPGVFILPSKTVPAAIRLRSLPDSVFTL